MRAYLKMTLLLRVCFLQCLPLFLQAQASYRFSVPVTPGASSAPVILEEEPLLIPHAHLRGPPILPPPGLMMPRPPLAPNMNLPFENQAQPFLSKAPLAPEKALDILDFWFGSLPNPAFFPEDKMLLWFGSSAEYDRQIREKFSQDIVNALHGEYNSWRETPKGRLALILLLDQFPRYVYRNKPQAFVFDRMARALTLEGIQKGDDQYLYPIERAYFYLPLEHAEDPEMQALSVDSYRQLFLESPLPIKPQMEAFFQYALLRQQQIARFGRFPHRNVILGRESTPEEVVFLRQWGKSF